MQFTLVCLYIYIHLTELTFITDTFGSQYRPRIAWHIDTFGHSSEQASLFAMVIKIFDTAAIREHYFMYIFKQMGFDEFYFARIDYDDKNNRIERETMEMVWRGSPSLRDSTEIFTGVLYHHYTPPDRFCFDQSCTDQPIQVWRI